jgi:O-methyltransferase involved in polyketide biosynthesis
VDDGAGGRRYGADRPDETVPANARVWDYWLGGKTNFEVDRRVGDAVAQMFPLIPEVARADRAFLQRAVTFLAREAGIRQFLDVGTGLPAANNTHEVAQQIAPDARVVYVDHDPIVLAHARILLASSPSGRTAYVDADAHDPEEILRHAAQTLDFSRPVALLMLGVLNFLPDTAAAEHTALTLIDSLAPGSYVAVTHPTLEYGGEGNVEAMRFWNENTGQPIVSRTREQVLRFFGGLELLEPGLVSCTLWRPDDVQVGNHREVPQYGGVAVKR